MTDIGIKAIARLHSELEAPTFPKDVFDIPDASLLSRAVSSARSRQYRKGVKHARWVAVQDAFGLGSTFSHQLCRRFGFDPDEQVRA